MTAVRARKRAPRQGFAIHLLRLVRSWETNSVVDLLGVDLADLRKAAAAMTGANNSEMCYWETNGSHGKTRTRPLLFRHRA